ncbi:hypothetical protein ACFSE0_12560 [Ochrobactrum teleogrylli]|uniref:Transposase n=1 Tax=Ochrobactrum teleogrylli TaxID=2479765 RepID=A0ABY2Y577_9HYPH|nr:hypothetical protein [[Ochrobactrum] teleogrylli]TNV15854.1 hypothetical protein FIC94_11240 [[Ochrobactrum] teleogrylli]
MNLLSRIRFISVTEAKANAFERVHPVVAKRNKALLCDMTAAWNRMLECMNAGDFRNADRYAQSVIKLQRKFVAREFPESPAHRALLRDMEAFIVAKPATVESVAIAKRGGLN